MARQNKGSICPCGCGEKKTSRKLRYAPGHSAFQRTMNIYREVEFDFACHARAMRQMAVGKTARSSAVAGI